MPDEYTALDDYKRVVVTGGRGFIGRQLVSALRAYGRDIVVLDRVSTPAVAAGLRAGTPTAGRVEHLVADIRDPAMVGAMFQPGDLVFHLAGNPNASQSVRQPDVHFGDNCIGTFNLLQASAAAGVGRFVYVSSASSYGVPQTVPITEMHPLQPIVPYGATKLAGEHLGTAFWHSHGLPFVVVRPFCVYGPGDNPAVALTEVNRYLRWHLNGQPIQIVGDRTRKTRDFIHVSDLVAGLLLVADRAPPGEAFNLGSGTETSMAQLVEMIERATGRPATVTELAQLQDDTYRLVADITKAGRLGYAPRVPLDDGVARLAAELGPTPELPTGETIFRIGQRAERQQPNLLPG